MSKGQGVKPEERIMNQPQPTTKPTQQDFATEYQALCKRTGWQIIGQAGLKPLNDLGGYITVVQLAVAPYQEPPPQG